MAGYLYREDTQNPDQARAIARRELPNLLHAARQALDVGDPDAVDFVDSVNKFLTIFGMTRESALLTQHAEKLGSKNGSKAWYLAQSNRGEQLFQSGQVEKATEIFSNILNTLGEEANIRPCKHFGQLGRCYRVSGRPDLAEILYRRP